MSDNPAPAPVDAAELAQFSLFRSAPAADLLAVARVLRVRDYGPGEIVFERRDPGDSLFLIRRGQMRIFIRDSQDNEVTYRFYGPGQMVGEFSLIDGRTRSASADAYDLAQLLVLERGDFMNLLRDHPIIGIEVMRALAERLRYGTRVLEKATLAVELLKQDDYGRALQEMTVDAGDGQLQDMVVSFVEMIESMQQRRASAGSTVANEGGDT